ncbi:hypothetical protein LOD99_267 [Oopsacas minuta]|uniref:Uncharacterized protein n=1 Tax=Oopsacas minuta TaxID=111878 RepID=A0AAV7K8G7_9METZ|nr:hypothetical protein LOD99_267 [Oopsacas minuta]
MSKNRIKEKEFLDPATNHVFADYTKNEPTDFMDRIHQVNRLCPGQSKQNINYLLQSNNYDVGLTIQRINEEGAKELIGEWSKSTSKKSKKKKANAQKEQTTIIPNSKPQNNMEIRPASDSRTTKLPNSISHKPTTAPPIPTNSQINPKSNSYQPALPDTYNDSHLQPSHHFNPDNLQSHNSVVNQRVSPNLSTGGSSNVQILLLQLQTQNSQLAQWQEMLQQRMDNSLQILQFVFEQLQSSLSERHQLLFSNLESGKWKAQEIFEQRRKLAQKLIAQAKKAPTEQAAENIKQFLADKHCDQQLNDVYTLEIEHEALLTGVQSLGDIVNSIPIYSNWTPGLGSEHVPSHIPAVYTQPIQQPIPSKYPPKQVHPIYTVPDTHVLPVHNSTQPQHVSISHTYSEPDPVLFDGYLEQEPAPDVVNLTSRVMEVTLKDPYSSEAKAVDLKSLASKTSKEELEAAKLRMQGVLDKQGRSMIVAEARGRGPGGRRGGEKRGGRAGTGNKPRGKYKEQRGPQRYQDQGDERQDQWTGSRDNGHVWSAEFTSSNPDEPDTEALDSHLFVKSLELVNHNYSDGETDAIDYNPIVPSTEFNSSQQDYSPEQPPLQSTTTFLPTETKQIEATDQLHERDPDNTDEQTSTTDPAINCDKSPVAKPATNWGLDGDW